MLAEQIVIYNKHLSSSAFNLLLHKAYRFSHLRISQYFATCNEVLYVSPENKPQKIKHYRASGRETKKELALQLLLAHLALCKGTHRLHRVPCKPTQQLNVELLRKRTASRYAKSQCFLTITLHDLNIRISFMCYRRDNVLLIEMLFECVVMKAALILYC